MAEAESELLRFYRPYVIKSNGRECQQWPRPPRRDSAGVCRLASISKRHANRTTAFANAQRARALILAGLGVANASQPLIPIVQLHVSAECFDPTLVSERPVVS